MKSSPDNVSWSVILDSNLAPALAETSAFIENVGPKLKMPGISRPGSPTLNNVIDDDMAPYSKRRGCQICERNKESSAYIQVRRHVEFSLGVSV